MAQHGASAVVQAVWAAVRSAAAVEHFRVTMEYRGVFASCSGNSTWQLALRQVGQPGSLSVADHCTFAAQHRDIRERMSVNMPQQARVNTLGSLFLQLRRHTQQNHTLTLTLVTHTCLAIYAFVTRASQVYFIDVVLLIYRFLPRSVVTTQRGHSSQQAYMCC
jgi:Na+/melibiose symporter-like transporter